MSEVICTELSLMALTCFPPWPKHDTCVVHQHTDTLTKSQNLLSKSLHRVQVHQIQAEHPHFANSKGLVKFSLNPFPVPAAQYDSCPQIDKLVDSLLAYAPPSPRHHHHLALLVRVGGQLPGPAQ